MMMVFSLSGGAFADDNLVLFKQTVETKWEALEKVIDEDNGFSDDRQSIKREILAEYAYATAMQRNAVPAGVTKEVFIASFVKQNGFEAFVPVATLHKMARAEQILIPVKFDAPVEKAAPKEGTTGPDVPAGIEKRLKALEERLANEPTKKKFEALLTDTESERTRLTEWFAGANEKLGKFVEKIEKSLQGDKKEVEGLVTRQNNLEGEVQTLWATLVGLIVAIVTVAGLAIASLWKTLSGSRKIATLAERINKHDERINKHDERFTKVEAKLQQGLNLALGISVSPMLAQQLSGLAPNKDTPVEITVNGKKITIRIAKTMVNGECKVLDIPFVRNFQPSDVGEVLRELAAEGQLTQKLKVAA